MKMSAGAAMKSLGLSLLLAGISACGSGNDPLLMLGNPDDTPSMGLPSTSLTFASAFSSSQDSIGVTAAGGLPVVSPAAGTIVKIETVSTPISGYAIWIYHSAHVSSRVTIPTTVVPGVRVGDYVADGQSLANLTIASLVYMSVFYNSTAVCPAGFLKAAARTQIAGFVPCN